MPRVSAKHQITLPVDVLKRAGLESGDEVAIESGGADLIVVRRVHRRAQAGLGVFDGLYEPGYLRAVARRRACVTNCVLDTDVVIAALDRRDAHHQAAVAAITTMIDRETRLLLSLVNYAETLVRPAEQSDALAVAQDALRTLGIRLIAPTAAIATDAARHRRLKVSLADGFALATAQAHRATVATFDRRVRRALPLIGVDLAPELGAGKIAAVSNITVYEKPTCTTCRNLYALLRERGVDFDSVDYHVTGIEEPELRELLEKLGTGPREILRTREPLVKELGLDDPAVSDEQLIAQMVAHPELVQRPIVVSGDRAVLARPVERVLDLL